MEKVFSATIVEVSKELTAKERVSLKDTSNAVKLDEATANGSIVIAPAYYAVLSIHNEKSDSKEYFNYIIVDKSGTKFVTGSQSFWNAFNQIVEEMDGTGEEYEIEIYRKDSKNYKGKQFITCSIV